MRWDTADLVDRAILLDKLETDYQRRRRHWWGRMLLWLLRKTT